MVLQNVTIYRTLAVVSLLNHHGCTTDNDDLLVSLHCTQNRELTVLNISFHLITQQGIHRHQTLSQYCKPLVVVG